MSPRSSSRKQWPRSEQIRLAEWVVEEIDAGRRPKSLDNIGGNVDLEFLERYCTEYNIVGCERKIQALLQRMKVTYRKAALRMSTSGHGVHDRQTLKERLDKECCYYELGGKIWKDITHVQAPYLTGSTRIGRSVTTSEQELRGRSIGANTVAPHNDGISESEEDEHSSPTPSFVQAQSATREEMPIQGSSRDINTLQRRPTVRQASRSVTGSIADAGRHIRARTASDSLEMLRVQRENSESVLSKYQEEFLKLEREKLEEMKKFNEEMISVKRLKIESNTVDILKMKIDLINKKIELENLLQRRTQQGGTAAEPAFGTIDPSILSILRE